VRARAAGRLLAPVRGVEVRAIRDSYHERRGVRRHEALDIMAPHGTAVLAADDGRIGKLSRSLAGGISIHQVDREGRFVYYYAHLAGYADGLSEGMEVRRGDVIGFVGSTGNASAKAPHLHFAVFRMAPGKRWWKGPPLNPHPLLTGAA
jgi:murein DD-endopeptidase MepM/ murein hydrolase activator NlpD